MGGAVSAFFIASVVEYTTNKFRPCRRAAQCCLACSQADAAMCAWMVEVWPWPVGSAGAAGQALVCMAAWEAKAEAEFI